MYKTQEHPIPKTSSVPAKKQKWLQTKPNKK